MSTQRELDIQWLKNFLGDAFVRGVGIRGRVAIVIVKTDTGEREVQISLPETNKEL